LLVLNKWHLRSASPRYARKLPIMTSKQSCCDFKLAGVKQVAPEVCLPQVCQKVANYDL
jgi:hypothetical protein